MKHLETTRNVLVAVDIQNDFITGSLAVAEGEQVVAPINEIAAAVRQTEGDVAFTRDWHPTVTPHFADYGGAWPVHCVAETEGAAFHPDLDVQPADTIISKGTGQADGYSGWEGVSDDGQTLETIITPAYRANVSASTSVVLRLTFASRQRQLMSPTTSPMTSEYRSICCAMRSAVSICSQATATAPSRRCKQQRPKP